MNAFSLSALAIAALSLFVTVIETRRKRDDTTQEHKIKDQDRQIEELKGTQIQQGRELDECKRARDAFEDKNFQLLQEAYDTRKLVDSQRHEIDELRRRVDKL